VAERSIVGRIAEHGDVRVILRRRTQQRRAADIDVLDSLAERHVAARHGLFERIEIDDDKIDRLDPLCRHHRIVDTAAGEDPAMDFGVQGLDPAFHHFREAGMSRYIAHFETGLAQGLRRSAG
jgi:hypothetical protein